MKFYDIDIDATEYLNNVLKTWGTFCETHRCLADAIQEVLEENKMLKQKTVCVQCVHHGEKSCPLFYGEAGSMRFFTPYAKNDDFSCDKAERRIKLNGNSTTSN